LIFKIIIVYVYAGLAKLRLAIRSDALKIWLPNSNLPLIGSLLNETWVHYVFSWTGAIYDLELYCYYFQENRLFGFILVVVFHVLTKILFPIVSLCNDHQLLIFFDASFHKKGLSILGNVLYSFVLFENGKEKHNTLTPYIKPK
jgi:hypothetical protein